ncbi:hypothetical protein NP493_246g01018 [Ridgeia piscesae]|uniref:Uncharacterized protein n=1 Tax=Ridgeia piscesae TaxID=27915 RepID=A0AAD9UDA2_RIDPI|nr:hypothetical protein NP493_246g01018 [Ridgeia piscesae]
MWCIPLQLCVVHSTTATCGAFHSSDVWCTLLQLYVVHSMAAMCGVVHCSYMCNALSTGGIIL